MMYIRSSATCGFGLITHSIVVVELSSAADKVAFRRISMHKCSLHSDNDNPQDNFKCKQECKLTTAIYNL